MLKIGIDLGGTNIAAGIVNENGEILHKSSVPTGASRPKEEIIDDIALLCRNLCKEYGVGFDDIDTVGIAVPGGVDKKNGTIIRTPNIPFSGLPICDILSEKLDGKKIVLANDADAATLAEVLAGAAKGASNAIMITLGTGVGGGIVIDKKIYSGSNGLAGELGHFVIEKGGEQCGCGRRGCFEAYASATALIRMTKDELNTCFMTGEATLMAESGRISARTAFDAFKKGDAAAARVIERYTDALANGITSLINIFQPDVFIIGGGVSGEKQFLVDLLQPKIDKEDFAREAAVRTHICTATCGNDAGIIGAALS
ncbi:MAG: ROK family protein [Clostridia bacterium]|nr:ROK family protein [Clostridia bacterium]MBQ6613735.1 ROK family protein [Clostridia bacterium]